MLMQPGVTPMDRFPQMGHQSAPVASQTPVGIPPLPPTLTAPTPSPAQTPAPAPGPAPAPAAALPPPPSVAQATPISAQNALNNFANSAGMKFAMQQGANSLNNLYAAHGEIQSGAAAKALESFGQNTALQSYFFPYMNYLTGQQAMGAQAAGAIGGVGSSYGNTVAGMGQNYVNGVAGAGQSYANGVSGQGYANAVTGINGNIANALGQGATNIGNANANQALANGYANAGLGSAIGSGLGQLGSSFFHPTTATSVNPGTINVNPNPPQFNY